MSESTKGISLVQGTVAVLSLDGSLVYVEQATNGFLAVVALPEQPDTREDERVLTPGRVGSKKISPYAKGEPVDMTELSVRNREFIGTYETLRTKHGPNFVDRTPEEVAKVTAAMAPKPTKEERAAARAKEKADAKAAKPGRVKKEKEAKPQFLQRCTQCNEQRGHPNHWVNKADGSRKSDADLLEDKAHDFVAPIPKCVACNREEGDAVHGKSVDDGGHTFVPGGSFRPVKSEKEPKAERTPRAAKPEKPGKPTVDPSIAYKWTGDPNALVMLASVNPKYKEGNSGAAIAEMVRASADEGASITEIMTLLSQHERWSGVPFERVTVAFLQLAGAGLIAPVE